MKRILSLAIAALLMVCVVALPAFATEDLSCYLVAKNDNPEVTQGEVTFFIDGAKIVPGNSYTISAMVKFDGIELTDIAGAHPYVSMYDWKEYHSDSFDGLGVWNDFANVLVGGSYDWSEYSFTFTAEDPTECIAVNVGHYGSMGTVCVAWIKLVDNASGDVIAYEDFADGLDPKEWETPRGDNLSEYSVVGYTAPETEAPATEAPASEDQPATDTPAAQTGSFVAALAVIAAVSAAGCTALKKSH